MVLVTTNIDTEDEEKVYETIIHGIEARINEGILIGHFGAMRTNDEATQEYYLVKWITEPYKGQEDTIMKEVDPQQSTFSREIVCDAVFWNPVPNAIDWYTPMSKREGLVVIRLKQVLITYVTMIEISENNILPSKYNRQQTKDR